MKPISRSILYIVIAVGVAIGITSCVKAQGLFFEQTLVGQKAPNFILDTLKGGKISLYDVIKGKKSIVFFWATWCPHCHEQVGGLGAKKADIEKNGIQIVLVDIQESPAKVQRFMKHYKLDYDVFLDRESYAASMYQVSGYPTLVFIGADGKIRSYSYGLPEDYADIFK